jgi:hypothetical protein
MKATLLSLLIFVFLVPGVKAQEWFLGKNNNEPRTLLGNNPKSFGGYLSFHMGNAMLKNNDALMGQIRLAARIDHSFSIGVTGTLFSDYLNGLNFDRPVNFPDGYYIEGGYGGFFIEPVFAPHFPVHLSFPLMVGAGGVLFTEEYSDDYWEYQSGRYVTDGTPFIIVEPGVELEINLVRFIRLTLGASYRFTSVIIMNSGRDHLLNGVAIHGGIKMGVF